MADPNEISRLTAYELGRALAAGRLDAVDVTEAYLERIAACDDRAVFIAVTKDRALNEARAARRRLKAGKARSPLDGVPIALKDAVDLAGCVTTMGSKLYARRRPLAAADAPVARNLVSAGMVMLGKTNMPEFAYSGLGINPHFGTPRNPHGTGGHHLPGGSSSGSAVAVARALAPVAIGSDTAGSVRIPAAWCGISGYHLSRGSVDLSGVLPLAPSLDTVGVIARDVTDCALVGQALRGEPVLKPRPANLGRVRILVPDNEMYDGIAEDVAANFERSLKLLARAGAKIVRRTLSAFSEARSVEQRHGRLLAIEGYFVHREDLSGRGAKLVDPFIAERFLKVADTRAADYMAIQQARLDLGQVLAGEMDGFDVLAYPTTRETAPLISAATRAVQPSINTQFGNFFSLCGIALPNGLDHPGMPTSIALAARNGGDGRLLSIALAAERALR